jgi:hypothetical protein
VCLPAPASHILCLISEGLTLLAERSNVFCYNHVSSTSVPIQEPDCGYNCKTDDCCSRFVFEEILSGDDGGADVSHSFEKIHEVLLLSKFTKILDAVVD